MASEPRGTGPRSIERLVELATACPRCGKREARRVAVWRLDLYRHADPSRVCETIKCKCGEQYVITAAAYQGAA